MLMLAESPAYLLLPFFAQLPIFANSGREKCFLDCLHFDCAGKENILPHFQFANRPVWLGTNAGLSIGKRFTCSWKLESNPTVKKKKRNWYCTSMEGVLLSHRHLSTMPTWSTFKAQAALDGRLKRLYPPLSRVRISPTCPLPDPQHIVTAASLSHRYMGA